MSRRIIPRLLCINATGWTTRHFRACFLAQVAGIQASKSVAGGGPWPLRVAMLPPAETPQARSAAARLIGRCGRRFLELKHGRKSILRLIPSPQTVRKNYLDRKALDAGAASTEMYTEQMIAAREGLRRDVSVIRALDQAWERIILAKSLYGNETEITDVGSDKLDYNDYVLMSRKIYLALKATSAEGDFDPADCMADVEEVRDRRGVPRSDQFRWPHRRFADT